MSMARYGDCLLVRIPELWADAAVPIRNLKEPHGAPSVQVKAVERRDVWLFSEWTRYPWMVTSMRRYSRMFRVTSSARTTGKGPARAPRRCTFEIDPRPFQAALDQGRAQLLQAQAQLAQTRRRSRRPRPKWSRLRRN